VRCNHSVKGIFYEMSYFAFRLQYTYFGEVFTGGKKCTDNKEKMVIIIKYMVHRVLLWHLRSNLSDTKFQINLQNKYITD